MKRKNFISVKRIVNNDSDTYIINVIKKSSILKNSTEIYNIKSNNNSQRSLVPDLSDLKKQYPFLILSVIDMVKSGKKRIVVNY